MRSCHSRLCCWSLWSVLGSITFTFIKICYFPVCHPSHRDLHPHVQPPHHRPLPPLHLDTAHVGLHTGDQESKLFINIFPSLRTIFKKNSFLLFPWILVFGAHAVVLELFLLGAACETLVVYLLGGTSGYYKHFISVGCGSLHNTPFPL